MDLATYMHSYLGELADELEWTITGSYSFPIAETLELYGVSSEGDATNLPKLHAIAKVQVLEAFCRSTANAVDYKADNSSFSMSQMHKQAREMLADAKVGVLTYLDAYDIETAETIWEDDPYMRVEALSDTDA